MLNGFTKEYLASLFAYDPVTGLLTRKVARGRHNCHPTGEEVGGVQNGYRRVAVDGKVLYVHRIAYFLMTGETPPEVDHRDTDRLNNKFSNLRAATRQQNSANTRKHLRNATGCKGVHLCHNTGRYRAQIKINGKTTHLGRFDTPEAAAEAYYTAAKSAHGDFARKE